MHVLDNDILAVYTEIKGAMWNDHQYFTARDGALYGIDGTPYITLKDNADLISAINSAAKKPDSNVYAEVDLKENEMHAHNGYIVTDAFYKFLVSMDKWSFAGGQFETEMAKRMNR